MTIQEAKMLLSKIARDMGYTAPEMLPVKIVDWQQTILKVIRELSDAPEGCEWADVNTSNREVVYEKEVRL